MKDLTLKPERLLIAENEAPLAAILALGPAVFAAIQKAGECYNELHLPEPFNDLIFQEMVKYGTAGIEQKYQKAIEGNLDRLEIKVQALRKNILANSLEPFFELQNAWNEVIASASRSYSSTFLPLKIISIVDSVPVLSDEAIEDYTEKHCRVYLEEPAEHEVYEALQSLTNALNGFNEVMRAAGVPLRRAEVLPLLDTALKIDVDGQVSVNPYFVKAVAKKKNNVEKNKDLQI